MKTPRSKLWRRVGGSFNESETEHLANTPSSSRSQEIVVEPDILEHIRRGEVETAETKAQARFTKAMTDMNTDAHIPL